VTEVDATLRQAAAIRVGRRRWPGVLVIVAAAVALVMAAPLGLDDFTVDVLSRSLLYAILALTLDVLWGYTGILSYGQSAFFAIGAYALGLTSANIGFDPWLATVALVGGMAVAGLVAVVAGWVAFARGVPSLYVSVITLVLPILVKQTLLSGGTFTGSSSGLSGFASFDLDSADWFRIAGVGMVILTVLTWIFVRSDAGRLLVAIRENEMRCRYLGIHTTLIKIGLLTTSAVIAAGAGYVYAANTVLVAPELAGFEFGTSILIWVALGGRGTLFGPIIGAILIDLGSAYLGGSIPYVWKLIVGLTFVVVIVAMPAGFTPICQAVWRKLASLLGLRMVTGQALEVPRLAVATVGAAEDGSKDSPALVVRELRRRFGSLTVLDGINLSIGRGELVSLIGPNGAGKTTLMRCIADGAERTAGSVRINGHDIARHPPERCVSFGLARKFQNATIFDTLSVADCLRIATASRVRLSPRRRAAVLELPQAALDVILTTGLADLLSLQARRLSHGQKQALELAMVLALNPSVLLLDEPTAGLTKPERQLIGQVLAKLVHRHQLCILLVEHDLDFVREISSRVVVLHQGRIVVDGTVREVVASELVRAVYSGGHA
jgi:branched-chain amino acid transport system permease protein